LIKRRETIKGLEEIIRGRVSTLYAQRLADFIDERLKKERAA
jgi:hypothetical protein